MVFPTLFEHVLHVSTTHEYVEKYIRQDDAAGCDASSGVLKRWSLLHGPLKT